MKKLMCLLLLSSLSFGFISGCTFSKDAKKEEDKKSGPELQTEQIKNLSKELIEASEDGDSAAVDKLLSQGADINYRDSRGYNALMSAVQFDHIETYKLLIQRGALAFAGESLGQDSAISLAEYLNKKEFIEIALLFEQKNIRFIEKNMNADSFDEVARLFQARQYQHYALFSNQNSFLDLMLSQLSVLELKHLRFIDDYVRKYDVRDIKEARKIALAAQHEKLNDLVDLLFLKLNVDSNEIQEILPFFYFSNPERALNLIDLVIESEVYVKIHLLIGAYAQQLNEEQSNLNLPILLLKKIEDDNLTKDSTDVFLKLMNRTVQKSISLKLGDLELFIKILNQKYKNNINIERVLSSDSFWKLSIEMQQIVSQYLFEYEGSEKQNLFSSSFFNLEDERQMAQYIEFIPFERKQTDRPISDGLLNLVLSDADVEVDESKILFLTESGFNFFDDSSFKSFESALNQRWSSNIFNQSLFLKLLKSFINEDVRLKYKDDFSQWYLSEFNYAQSRLDFSFLKSISEIIKIGSVAYQREVTLDYKASYVLEKVIYDQKNGKSIKESLEQIQQIRNESRGIIDLGNTSGFVKDELQVSLIEILLYSKHSAYLEFKAKQSQYYLDAEAIFDTCQKIAHEKGSKLRSGVCAYVNPKSKITTRMRIVEDDTDVTPPTPEEVSRINSQLNETYSQHQQVVREYNSRIHQIRNIKIDLKNDLNLLEIVQLSSYLNEFDHANRSQLQSVLASLILSEGTQAQIVEWFSTNQLKSFEVENRPELYILDLNSFLSRKELRHAELKDLITDFFSSSHFTKANLKYLKSDGHFYTEKRSLDLVLCMIERGCVPEYRKLSQAEISLLFYDRHLIK